MLIILMLLALLVFGCTDRPATPLSPPEPLEAVISFCSIPAFVPFNRVTVNETQIFDMSNAVKIDSFEFDTNYIFTVSSTNPEEDRTVIFLYSYFGNQYSAADLRINSGEYWGVFVPVWPFVNPDSVFYDIYCTVLDSGGTNIYDPIDVHITSEGIDTIVVLDPAVNIMSTEPALETAVYYPVNSSIYFYVDSEMPPNTHFLLLSHLAGSPSDDRICTTVLRNELGNVQIGTGPFMTLVTRAGVLKFPEDITFD